ncbi:MAG: hypothetical protein LUF89_10265 [Ruminococcus sp.]|nr:hypothetical protein [Ruminococcus sp.]
MEKKYSAQSYSYRIALGGIIASMCMMCMFLTGVIPMLYLLLPMATSGLIYIMALETSPHWGLMTYISVGLLSIFVTPNKDASLVFILFFGYYPLLCPILKRLHCPPLAFLIRMAIFNAAVLVFFYGSIYLLGADELWDSLGKYGKYGGYILLGIANVMFVSYDYLIGIFPTAYNRVLKPRIFPTKKS